jgi:hypothetical protein
LSEIDKDQIVHRKGYDKVIWDYSVDFPGPSDRIVSQALRCAARERELYIKTETAYGIELLHLPYVPAMGRSARRWQAVRGLRPAGVLQRWGFIGNFNSVAERVGFKARWDPDFTPEKATGEVAHEMFGPAAAEIVRAWQAFDDAVGFIPVLTTGGYYIGPAFLGPAHPLATEDGPTPQVFHGSLFYLLEGEATFSPPRSRGQDDLTLRVLPWGNGAAAQVMEDEFARARDAASGGYEILKGLKVAELPATIQEQVQEQQAIGEYLYRTFRATVNTLRFLRVRAAGLGNRAKLAALVEIARDELENTRQARRVYEVAPWLNHALRLDVGCSDSIQMVDEKIRMIERIVAS